MDIRARDVAALLLCAVAIIASLQTRGSAVLSAAFTLQLDAAHYANKHFPAPHERLPPPLVTDLDGDGHNEVIVATREPALTVLAIPPEAGIRVVHASALRTVSLMSSVRVARGRQPVALAAGYLDPYDDEHARQQVVVVLTEDWTVLCFDHQLRPLWETRLSHLEDTLGLGRLYHREAALLVLPLPMRAADRGVVLVGGAMDLVEGAAAEVGRVHGAPSADGAQARFGAMADDAASEEGVWAQGGRPDSADETMAQRMRAPDRSAVRSDVGGEGADMTDGEWEDVMAREEVEGFEARLRRAQHFSFYALDGRTGEARWRHEAGDFHEPMSGDDRVSMQHQYRLAEAGGALARHAKEVDWREFRLEVLRQLPATWRAREDTALRVDHFERRRLGRGDSPWATQKSVFAHDHHLLGLSHLAGRPHAELEHTQRPNVVVARMRRGIEVIHLWSGRTLVQLPLLPGGTYADVNGDGIIDRAVGVSGEHTVWRPGVGSARVPGLRLPACFASVSSGVPPLESLFNGSLCEAGGPLAGLHSPQGGGLGGQSDGDEEAELEVEVAEPCTLRELPEPVGLHNHRPSGASSRLAYLTSRGTVTCFESHGLLEWQVQTPARWRPLRHQEFEKQALLPSVTALSLLAGGDSDPANDVLLALGEEMAALLSRDGEPLGDVPLAHAPVAVPVVGDFNNDGTNDVLVVTATSIQGVAVMRTVGSRVFTALVACFVLGLVGLWLNVALEGMGAPAAARAHKRATD